MKIVFVYVKEPHMSFGQVGIEIMCSLLRQDGHTVYGLVDSTYDPSDYATEDEKRNLAKLSNIEPDFICFSTLSHRYQWCLKYARQIKISFPLAKIIFGGPHPTAVPETVIHEHCVDIVCIGEGEYAMQELAASPHRTDIKNMWFKVDGEIIKNGLRPLIQDLDALPYPSRDMWMPSVNVRDFKRYLVMLSRGCPRACSYCFNSFLHELYDGLGSYLRLRSVDNVIDELKIAKEKYGINWVLFMDDNLTLKKEWFKEFSTKYKNEVNLPYTGNTHPQNIDDEVAKWLKDSGCKFIMVGIQSGSEEVRRRITNRHETNDDIRRMGAACHKAGLSLFVDHIFGLDDDQKYLRESAYLYNEIRPAHINPFFLYFFPETPIIKIKNLPKNAVEEINQGTYQAPTMRSSRDPKYLAYRNLFVCLPLLPKHLVDHVLEKEKVGVFTKVPEFIIWVIKVITNLKGGNTPSIVSNLKFFPHLLHERLRGYRGGFD